MNVLLISQVFPPSNKAVAKMVFEFAEYLSEQGNEVSVLSSVTSEEIHLNGLDLVGYKPNVVRVKELFWLNKGYVIRAVRELLAPIQYYFSISRSQRQRIDVVICYTPPIPLGLLGAVYKKLYGAKFLLNIQDIFPQNAVDLKIIGKNGIAVNIFRLIEYLNYRFANFVTCHTPSSTSYVSGKNEAVRGKISTVSNWIDFEKMPKSTKQYGYRKKYNLEDRFLVLFGGTIGPSQGLEVVIQIARSVRDLSDVKFIVMGEGTEKQKLEHMVVTEQLENVIFLDPLEPQQYSRFLNEIDLGLAVLSNLNTTPVYPGKIVHYMACSVPVLGYFHEKSDGHRILREANCGFSQTIGDEEKATMLFRKVYATRDELKEMGRNGYVYATRYFSKERSLEAMSAIVESLG